jgi:hypothetical protein
MAAEQHSTSGIAYRRHLNVSLLICRMLHDTVVVLEGVLEDLINYYLFLYIN